MNNRELEGKLKSAVEKSVPDIWERVQTDISHGKGEIITMSDKKRKGRVLGFVSSIAAALVLISAAVFGITNYNKADLKPVSTVYLEVNPQIELYLNTYNTVLKATPKNKDGKKVLSTMELENTQLDVALNAILGSMVKNGYLTKDFNSILISVEHENKIKANFLNKEVLKVVSNNAFDTATVVQTVENTSVLKAEAQKLNITLGKAEFINAIKETGAKASEEDLARLSVHELNLIYQSHIKNSGAKEGAESTGIATENKYIGSIKAKENALKDAKINEKDAKDLEVDLDYENGKMIYEVEFEVANIDYDYEIDAISGKIIKVKKEGEKNKPQTDLNSSKPSNASSNKIDAIIAPEDALKIALSHAGFSSTKAADVDVEFDKEGGNYHYDVDFKCDGYEYEYEIDALNGKVIKSDKELDD